MAMNITPVYLSTFLLEKNRWNGKGPSLLVSDWVEPIAEAGFRGMEIWFPHLLFSSRSEWESIREKSAEADIPVAFLYAQLPTDSSEKSHRQRDTLLEAADYFAPQGLKITVAEGGKKFEEQVIFLAEWSRDLPREVQLVNVFDHREPDSGEIDHLRQKLGSKFRSSLNPFAIKQKGVENLFREIGDSLINFDVRILSHGEHQALRDAEEACKNVVSLARQFDFTGSWTLSTTAGVGMPGEDIDMLFDEAEDDLNFLAAALIQPQ